MANLRCDVCLNDYPIERFPDLIRGVVCQSCIDGELIEKSEKVLKDKAQSMAGALAALEPEQVSGQLGSVSQILAEVYRNFGGPSGYASQLHAVLTELCNRKPMPTAVGHILINIMKLHHVVERSSKELSIKEMTVEQLKREQDMATLQLIAESMSDPSKMRHLELLFARYGKSIREADASEVIDVVAKQSSTMSADLPVPKIVPPPNLSKPKRAESLIDDDMPTEEEIQTFLDGET